MKKESIGVGLLGLGVIAGQVAKVMLARADSLAEHAGCPVILKKVKVLHADLARTRVTAMDPGLFTTDEDEFFNTPGIDIIVEAIGGERPAFDYLKRAISSGRHVVTSNKEVIAKRGAELRALAQENNVNLRFEASVGGGIPLVTPVQFELIANKITGIYAIINGTTNFILTRMEKDGVEFSQALAEAQKKGYAESNPVNDIEGIDATYKLAILMSLATHKQVRPEDIYHEGISRLSTRDFQYARELGFAIKLLAIAKIDNGAVEVRVHPVFIPEDSLLANVDGVYNAILVEGDLVGKVLFFGEGAGPLATSSAVVSDIVAEAQDINLGAGNRSLWKMETAANIKPMAEIETRYYLRMTVVDSAGVLAQISRVLGDNLISIASVIQKMTDSTSQTAEIVLMTHPAREKAMQKALTDLKELGVVKDIGNFVRVETERR
ncbi:MAG: homoserine dehydrogenase [Chloroflexota bacterium]